MFFFSSCSCRTGPRLSFQPQCSFWLLEVFQIHNVSVHHCRYPSAASPSGSEEHEYVSLDVCTEFQILGLLSAWQLFLSCLNTFIGILKWLFVTSLADIQPSPPQKLEKKETPAPTQSSPLQGQSVLSFSPSRPASSSPKFSPSCTPGYSPPLGSPSPPSSAGGPFTPSVAFGKVHVFPEAKENGMHLN